MGRQCLLPLELADCLTDSPHFRQNLHAYEKELENTSSSIKTLVKDIKEVLDAAKQLSRCQRAFATSLDKFQFDSIGGSQTDDEIVIAGSLKQFAALINLIEEERQRMLDHGHKHILGALESFRRTHIGAAKEGRKKFEKQTQKFCTSLERHLNLSTKKHEDQAMKEADASLEMEQRYFVQASLDYVCMLQEVQERKKFEFVETLLGCMYGWLTFYHQGHEVSNDYKGQMTDLQMRLQKTREEFESTRSEVESLKNKMMLDVRQTQKSSDVGTRQGYLYLMEKKAFGTTWTKHYCMYDKKYKSLSLIPYNQLSGKLSSTDQMVLKSCVRRMSESIDRRFCFDVTAEERDGQVYTLQAMSEEDRRLWMDAMDGKEPTYSKYGGDQRAEETALDDNGFHFVSSCIAQLEGRGLEEQGLYRVVGVNSKVSKLVQMGLSRQKLDKLPLDNPVEWETKTVTSAIKTFFRQLPEPLMTFRLHHDFINAAKAEKEVRVAEVHKLVRKLPKVNYRMLKILMQHAQNVSKKSDRNLMSVSNLGVCFGPTLMRPEEETMASIIDIKFCNTVVEILIKHFDTIFSGGVPLCESNGTVSQSGYSNGAVSSTPASNKPGIIAATAQPVQVQAYERDTVSRASRAPTSGRRHYPPPPYAHPPPPVYGPPPGQHPSPPSSSAPLAALAGATVATLTSAGSEPPSRQKPLHVYNPSIASEREARLEVGSSLANNSLSSSNESLSSRSSRDLQHTTNSSSSSPYTRGKLGVLYPPSYRSQTDQPPSTSAFVPSATTTDGGSTSQTTRRVRTLYACVGENETELSFDPNQIITNVRPSREPGWLEGTLNGHLGLVPENYVEYLP